MKTRGHPNLLLHSGQFMGCRVLARGRARWAGWLSMEAAIDFDGSGPLVRADRIREVDGRARPVRRCEPRGYLLAGKKAEAHSRDRKASAFVRTWSEAEAFSPGASKRAEHDSSCSAGGSDREGFFRRALGAYVERALGCWKEGEGGVSGE